jgi:fructose-specific phosphotransferase system IIC component
MHILLLFIGIVASVIAGYLTVELIHNMQLGEGMKVLQDIMIQGKVEKKAFISLVPPD